MPTALVVHRARLVDARGVVEDGWVAVADGAITATGTGDSWRGLTAAEVVDAGGATLVPGFLDLHVHGGGGGAIDDGADVIARMLAAHRAHGTTRSVLSLVAAPLEELERSLAVIAEFAAVDPLVLGSHLEGPFLAPGRRGAHALEALAEPTPEAVDRLLEAARGTLVQVTIAPELPGALDAISRFAAAGVVVALGHTEADADLARTAVDRGVRLITHAFNAMPGIHHRAPGPVPTALADPRVVLELILDGEHVHPDVARLAFAAAPDRIALVTDAMAAAGSADGVYRLGGLDVSVQAGRAVLSRTDTLAGSTLTQDRALRLALDAVGLSEPVAVGALTATPARVLGRTDLGLLQPGHRADLVLLDASHRVVWVRAEGRLLAC
ncbi:N-acetylglucosamine-6-phosphate deacetylase [Rathayibacter sp. VKM Ac-2630]|uniref:N-acetylglucosamine-6-phosphate deacetylase n=1 Tax=Rathayibacter sp. VKM Ac-2630 TaxID=1938617 RepID=UPI000980C94E|nr:N-acetylglucosamine-6-phosphate deacetylase [Rathayibacter sp. VKM Ac-2630]OOB92413.1 N-acetylglucosamine-6-phosphate deacetylase [Rathayibacter sp. VKM Ac-2630]